jgi:hypothetical protein
MPWNSSNPLYRWKMKHGGVSKHKVNKSATRHMSVVRHMPKRHFRRARRLGRRIRRYHKPRLSILTIGGAAIGAMAPGGDASWRYTSMFEALKNGITGTWGWDVVARDVGVAVTGYDYMNKRWSIPMFTTGIIAGAVASKIAGHFIKPQTFDAIPIIGHKIKL